MTAILLYVRKHEIKNGTESFDSVPEIKFNNEFYMKKIYSASTITTR